MSITPDEEPLEDFEPQPFEDENIADGDTDA
jgi:hypothetical protein